MAVQSLKDLESKSTQVVPKSLLMTIATRLISASSSSSAGQAKCLSSELRTLVDARWRQLEPAVKNALRNEADGPAVRAFVFGQLTFADALAAQMSDQREPDELRDEVAKGTFDSYLRALFDGERSGSELLDIVGHSEAHQSRQLAHMRKLGLSDFRKEGRTVVNFLTPIGRTAYERRTELKNARAQVRPAQAAPAAPGSAERAPLQAAEPDLAKQLKLQKIKETVPEILHRAQTVDATLEDPAYA